VTNCSLQTEETSETLDFDFTGANVLNRLIMQADCLKEAFSELDMSSEVVEMHLSPSPPHFRLTTCGYSGTTQVGGCGSWDAWDPERFFVCKTRMGSFSMCSQTSLERPSEEGTV